MDVAIVQMCSYGDVLISTQIIRAIREQRPDWRITYYTIGACSGAVANNPDIDSLVAIPGNKDRGWAIQDQVIAEARRKHQKVITPWAGWLPMEQWLPLQAQNYPTIPSGEISTNFMWAYTRAAQQEGLVIPYPPRIFLHLTDDERQKARDFVSRLDRSRRTVLIETEGHSSQSWLNEHWLPDITGILRERYGRFNLLISKGGEETNIIRKVSSDHPGMVFLLNKYSLREVSEIFNYCDVFAGCSSGTSNVCHAQHCMARHDTIQWFENTRSSVWDSRPLRPANGINKKHINHDENPSNFFEMLRNNLK